MTFQVSALPRYEQSRGSIAHSRQAFPQQVLVTRAHLAREVFLVFLRGASIADVCCASCVRLAGEASAAVTVGATSRGLSARDRRAEASADMAVSIAVIAEMRPSSKSRPNSFMNFLAAKRRIAESAPVRILFAINLVAIVRARIALWDVAYLMNKDVARWRKATAVGRSGASCLESAFVCRISIPPRAD